jgi:hypothetical protein
MRDRLSDVLSHLRTLLEELPEETGIPFQNNLEESQYQVEEVRARLLWPLIMTASIIIVAHDKFITELEVLLGITNGEELDILERGPGLVRVIDLLEEASEYFPGDQVLEGVVWDIYESVKAYYTEEGVQVSETLFEKKKRKKTTKIPW